MLRSHFTMSSLNTEVKFVQLSLGSSSVSCTKIYFYILQSAEICQNMDYYFLLMLKYILFTHTTASKSIQSAIN